MNRSAASLGPWCWDGCCVAVRTGLRALRACHGDVEQFIDHPAEESGLNVRLLRIADTGRVALTVNGLTGAGGDGNPQRLLWIEGAQVLTQAAATLAGYLADAAGYGGLWDVGVALTDVQGAKAARGSQLGYGSGRSYPDDGYTRLIQATSADLVEHPGNVADELLAPLRRVLT